MFVVPQLLISEGIPFKTIRQCPGDLVITFPGAFHTVVNAGTNVAEAINYAKRKWLEGTSGVAQCTCPKKDGIETIANSLKIMKLACPTVTGLISTGYSHAERTTWTTSQYE